MLLVLVVFLVVVVALQQIRLDGVRAYQMGDARSLILRTTATPARLQSQWLTRSEQTAYV